MLYRPPHLTATEMLCNCSSTKEPMSTTLNIYILTNWKTSTGIWFSSKNQELCIIKHWKAA
ncbi:hypothetical protein FOXYSP1_19018 [Fusarium oxysporum f. sp. phaseoli]